MTTYYLVRHGTTAWVDQQLLHGITDIPLNENGLQQAQRTSVAMQGIQADHLFSSPLSRTLQTAETIGKTVRLAPVTRQGLIEINFGWMEGKVIHDDVQADKPKYIYMLNHYWLNFIRFISGDSRNKFYKRVRTEWHQLQDDTHGQNTIIVAHSGVLDVILTECFGLPKDSRLPYYFLHPCSITEISIDEQGKPQLIQLNNHAHLQEWYPDHD